jgi:hypothetical protein
VIVPVFRGPAAFSPGDRPYGSVRVGDVRWLLVVLGVSGLGTFVERVDDAYAGTDIYREWWGGASKVDDDQ